MTAAPRHFLAAALVLLAVPVLVMAVPPGTADDIAARIAPIGSVCVAGGDCGDGAPAVAAAAADLSGAEVYDTYCATCHSIGVAGAPVFADADAWAPRVAKGVDALYASTINGIGAMPAGGTCGVCSEDDLKEAVDHMVTALD